MCINNLDLLDLPCTHDTGLPLPGQHRCQGREGVCAFRQVACTCFQEQRGGLASYAGNAEAALKISTDRQNRVPFSDTCPDKEALNGELLFVIKSGSTENSHKGSINLNGLTQQSFMGRWRALS